MNHKGCRRQRRDSARLPGIVVSPDVSNPSTVSRRSWSVLSLSGVIGIAVGPLIADILHILGVTTLVANLKSCSGQLADVKIECKPVRSERIGAGTTTEARYESQFTCGVLRWRSQHQTGSRLSRGAHMRPRLLRQRLSLQCHTAQSNAIHQLQRSMESLLQLGFPRQMGIEISLVSLLVPRRCIASKPEQMGLPDSR